MYLLQLIALVQKTDKNQPWSKVSFICSWSSAW